MSKLSPESRKRLPNEESIKRTLRNRKIKRFPPIPATLEELSISEDWATTGSPTNERFLLHDNGGDSNERIIIFATDYMLKMLAETKTWYIVGNFKLAPHLFLQLYVIRIPFKTLYIKAAYFLLQRKTYTTYEEIFKILLEKAQERNLVIDPITIYMDFEKAAINAVENTLGRDINIQGCFYHLTQSTHRKIQELGLESSYRNDPMLCLFAAMIDGLAFLPIHDVKRGMEQQKTEDMGTTRKNKDGNSG
ncbi:unnamed protein product [Gordionus sp. m RMFG-2023]